MTHLSIPSAPEVFSYNQYGLLNRLLISHDLRNDSQIGYNIGYNKYENYDGQFIYSLSYSKSLGSFGVFFEIFGDETTENSNQNFDSGIILSCFLSVIGTFEHEFRTNPQHPQPTYCINFLLSISINF